MDDGGRSDLQPPILPAHVAHFTAAAYSIELLIDESSGNYRIDEPSLELLFEVMAVRVEHDSLEATETMSKPHFPLEGMIQQQPSATSAALSRDFSLAVEMVRTGDLVLSPPARIVYRLIAADAELAAELVIAVDQLGEGDAAIEPLAYFAYDKSRSEKFPGLSISLKRNGDFLQELLRRKGDAWLKAGIADVVALYSQRVAEEEVAPDFLEQYRETLLASAASLNFDESAPLTTIVRAAFDEG